MQIVVAGIPIEFLALFHMHLCFPLVYMLKSICCVVRCMFREGWGDTQTKCCGNMNIMVNKCIPLSYI